MHIDQQHSYQMMWSGWEKEHPEVIARAKEVLKNNPINKGATVITTIIQIEKENPLALEALEEMANLYANLSMAIYKYIKSHSEPDDNTAGSPGVVGNKSGP